MKVEQVWWQVVVRDRQDRSGVLKVFCMAMGKGHAKSRPRRRHAAIKLLLEVT
jgi:hypothetical protein